MPWEDLRGEIESMFSVYSTVSDERLDRYYRWSLNWFRSRRAAKYVEALRFEQAQRRQRFREKIKGTYCLYCFGSIPHDYEKSTGHVRKFCCDKHALKCFSRCVPTWRLPDGDDSCSHCDRRYTPSLLAPEPGFCSSSCVDYVTADEPYYLNRPDSVVLSDPVLPHGADPVQLPLSFSRCLCCFGPLIGKQTKYCRKRCHRIYNSKCIPQWRLRDGEDDTCPICDRDYETSLLAPDQEVCSSKCANQKPSPLGDEFLLERRVG